MSDFPSDGPALPVALQRELFRSRKASPVEFAKAALDRVTEFEHLNFIRIPSADDVIAQARESEARWRRNDPLGPLDGVIATIKDNCEVKGWTTRWGSRATDSVTPWEDSPPVARLREAGAIFLGQTTLPEWGWKGVTDSPLTGITRNPFNSSRTSGGSSGGAAVAAAVGVSAINLSSDGGGSIRIPAAFCGVYGFKPTYGVVPAPVNTLPSLTTYGSIARNVEDAELMFEVLRGIDTRDPIAHYYTNLPPTKSGKLRIAYSPALAGRPPSADVQSAVNASIEDLRAAGHSVEEVGSVIEDPWWIMKTIFFGVFAHSIAKIDVAKLREMDQGMVAGPGPDFAPTLNDFVDAMAARSGLGVKMAAFHREYDLLLTPTVALTAIEAGRDYPEGMSNWFDWAPYTYPFNLTQQPAATVPCGFGSDGLPVGLQIVGARYHDKTVLDFSKLCTTVLSSGRRA